MNFVLSHYEEGSLGKQFEAETHGRGTYWMSFLPSYNQLLYLWNYWTLWMQFPRLIVFEAQERYFAFVIWCNFLAQQVLSAWFCAPEDQWDLGCMLSTAMKLLCVYLNTFLMRLLEVNSARVIWHEGTGCAQ